MSMSERNAVARVVWPWDRERTEDAPAGRALGTLALQVSAIAVVAALFWFLPDDPHVLPVCVLSGVALFLLVSGLALPAVHRGFGGVMKRTGIWTGVVLSTYILLKADQPEWQEQEGRDATFVLD